MPLGAIGNLFGLQVAGWFMTQINVVREGPRTWSFTIAAAISAVTVCNGTGAPEMVSMYSVQSPILCHTMRLSGARVPIFFSSSELA